MIHSKFIFVLLILLSPFFLINNSFPAGGTTSYKEIYDQLINLKADPQKSAAVSGLIIQRDEGIFRLENGTITLCSPVNGRVCAAVFTGSGIFSYTPPGNIEKEQLERFYEKQELNKEFNYLFLMFADNTLNELERKLNFQTGLDNSEADGVIDNAIKFLADESSDYFDTDLMKTFLEDEYNGSFYADISSGYHTSNPMFFRINPFKEEEVTLEKRTNSYLHHNSEIVNQSAASDSIRDIYKNFKVKERFGTTGYKIVSTIEEDLDFHAAADIFFASALENQHWVNFFLAGGLEVDSVFIGDHIKCEFFKGDDNFVLWVHPPEPFINNEPYRVTVYYHGDLLYKDELGWISLRSPDHWFPRNGYRQKVIYYLTFQYPSKYKFAASGDKVSADTSGDMVTSLWTNRQPARNASFNIGLFNEFNAVEDSLPAVTVYINRTGIKEIGNALASQDILLKGDMEEQIGGEIINCCRLFENMFGSTSLQHIYATPIPYYYGEAFPGLVHLSWATFHGLDDDVEGVVFRAHEIAHQWWGIGVDFKTYHDQWLSEAFSEFAGLSFAQVFFKGNDAYFSLLDKWKDQILDNRKYLFGSGQEAGPVSLGYRTQSSETKGDYDLIIYKKGAWILHMLRDMLIDLKTMNEDKFKSLMREFYSRYVGDNASTNDFKRICDKYFNEDMGWFFNQWVNDTGIPKYTFAYKSVKTEEDKYNVTCRIKQDGVPPGFKVYTVVQVKLDNEKFVRVRVKIDQPVTEFTIPTPAEPEEVIFNDLHSTLCEVDYEDWK